MELSKKFTDALKREWIITLPWTTEQRVMAETGITLDDLIPQEDGMPAKQPLHQIIFNRQTMFAILWAIFRPECEQKGITKEQFGDGFDGPTFSAAARAFNGALWDFFLNPLRQNLLMKGILGMDLAMKKLGVKLDEIDMEKVVDEQLKNLSTIVPESQGSIPDPTP